MKLTNNQKRNALKKIIEMPTPSWLTHQVYKTHLEDFDYHSATISDNDTVFIKNIGDMIGVSLPSTTNPNNQWGYVDVQVSAKILESLFDSGQIFSPPSTGQDPKTYTKSNLLTASNHAGNMWGNSKGSFWMREGVFNYALYPNGESVLEPTDIEHRFWGMIGFPKGLVKLKSAEKLYYSHPRIKYPLSDGTLSKRIRVNDLDIWEIVEKANKYTDDKCITKDNVLQRYHQNLITIRILPMYNSNECHYFFGQLNKSSTKRISQLIHADTYDCITWMKTFSSLKSHRFKPSRTFLNPFYLEILTNKQLVSLESLMISNMLCQFNINRRKFVGSTDVMLQTQLENTNGYSKYFDEELKESVEHDLISLYTFFSKLNASSISRQLIQQVLSSIDWVLDNNKVICDWDTFSKSLYNFIETNRTHQLTKDNVRQNIVGTKTLFGKQYGGSQPKDYIRAFTFIRDFFLIKNIIKDDDELSIGVSNKSSCIPRLFKSDVILDSHDEHQGKDIDGKLLEQKPVGGHIISDYELVRLSDVERDNAFKSEGLGDKFDFDKNCRAMSPHHNRRMSILRLGEYIPIRDYDDESVKKAIKQKYETLSKKPILI